MVKRIGKPLLGAISLVALWRYGQEPEYLKENLLWDMAHVAQWVKKQLLLPFYHISSTTPEWFGDVKVSKDVMIPMRDGVRLCTDVYLPDVPCSFPTIVKRIPYGKNEYYTHLPAYGRFFAKCGYAFVTQDVRGKFASEGEFDPMVNEVEDGYDTLEWISQQVWCDGQIGMMGESYYPRHPLDITVDVNLWARAEQMKDRALLAQRPDVLTYDSCPLDTPLNITGPIQVTLYAASSAVDTDFTAALVDLHPNGYAHLIQEGIVRASYRQSDRHPTSIQPRKVYQYTIDLWATSYIIKAGHQIRIELSSSNFNRYDRNPNTGERFGTATQPINARQLIHHSAKYPSHITLPILERPG